MTHKRADHLLFPSIWTGTTPVSRDGLPSALSPQPSLAGAGAIVFHEMTELVELLDHSSARIA